MQRFYDVWYIDTDGKEEYENYTTIMADSIQSARDMADEIFGDYVISVSPK